MNTRVFKWCWLILSITSAGSIVVGADQSTDAAQVDPDHALKRTKGLALFKSEVRNILKEHCVQCHGGDSTEGRLDLATQQGLLKGGERGPAAIVGRGDKSLMMRLATHRQEPHMPKDSEKLSEKQLRTIEQWIDLGAPYDEPLVAGKAESGEWTTRTIAPDAKKLWSYQPLRRIEPPSVRDERDWVNSPIDRFILAKLNEVSLQPNDAVARPALARRLFFDLIGLPPSVDEVEDFVNDQRPDAHERLVDRLLASPHYGERWGRRWLDLVRFAESHGFEHDTDRPSAFHYRDFVVQALNANMPYDQFVRWQVAGDELAPHDRLAMMATGFLAAGVHSTQITKSEVEKHRYDEMDDMLNTIGTSLLGLTIGCARCHDHKFDAIPQADYYRLLSTFTATVRSEVELDFDPDGYQRAKSEYEAQHAPFERAVQEYEQKILPSRFAEWHSTRKTNDDSRWQVPREIVFKSQGKAEFRLQPDDSWKVTGPNPKNDSWTITFNTTQTNLRSLRLEALADASLPQSGPGRAANGNFALSDISVRVRPLGSADDVVATTVKLVGAQATFEQKDLPVAAAIDDDPKTAWAIDPEFGKNHAAVLTAAEPFGFAEGTAVIVTLQFNSNTQHSIGRPRLTISEHADPSTIAGTFIAEEIHDLLKRPLDQLNDEQLSHLQNWYKRQDAGWKDLDGRRAAHAANAPQPRIQKVLVATEGLPPLKLHTQAESEFLKETHFLRRGDPNNKESVATQSFLQVLMANPNTPQLYQQPSPPGWRTSFQRVALTNWLADREAGAGNLLARVIINRLWQHHVGRGIVATPSDFGVRGETPSHPELLDWLATDLVRHDWDLKSLHRRILASRTYCQSAATDDARDQLDRENKFLWHRPRRRLEAEAIRDSILSVSDDLDDRLYGPGQLDERHRRRSLYFTVKRSQLMTSMTVFDAPDGTTPVAERPQTTIAPQALMMLNSPQIRRASSQFAAGLRDRTRRSTEETVRFAYAKAIGRPPTSSELTRATRFLEQRSASNSTDELEGKLIDFCQVLFCLNEFVYVE